MPSTAGIEETMETVVSADGTPIAVWRSGQGPPLVLVHGTVADHGRWSPVLAQFGERRTVLAVDRRGRGASGDADNYSLEQEVADVVAVVEGAGADVSLLGHSYGGFALSKPRLKSVFANTGVHSRRELLAKLGSHGASSVDPPLPELVG